MSLTINEVYEWLIEMAESLYYFPSEDPIDDLHNKSLLKEIEDAIKSFRKGDLSKARKYFIWLLKKELNKKNPSSVILLELTELLEGLETVK